MEGSIAYQVLSIVLTLVAVLVTYYVVPWLRGRIGAQNMNTAMILVKAGVAAAEQIFSKPEQGELKYKYVVEFLKDKGITITEQELKALIEAAVYELNRANNLLVKDLDLQPTIGTVEFSE
jgi:hypothetical protein